MVLKVFKARRDPPVLLVLMVLKVFKARQGPLVLLVLMVLLALMVLMVHKVFRGNRSSGGGWYFSDRASLETRCIDNK
jgi:Ca2+/Na+ antiporter